MAGVVKIKLVKSPIGTPPKQRQCLQGLGLKKMNQERELEDTPSVRGMIFKVKHLVRADPPARPDEE
ncbi:MAG: 50S ribosomal protein L30 [bacterium]